MPYKDPKKQKAAQAAWAAKHRENNLDAVRKTSTYRRRRAFKFIASKKESNPCTDCGIGYPYFVMHFDHINDDKTNDVSAMASGGYGLERIQEEIDKCELVCANCHAVRTWERKEQTR